MADPTQIEFRVPSTQASIQTAIDRVRDTTKWVTIDIAPGEYSIARAGSFASQIEYGLLLSGVSRLHLRAKGGGRVVFNFNSADGTSNPCNAIIQRNSHHIWYDGIRFVGSDNDVASENYRPAVLLYEASTWPKFTNCEFENCVPLGRISNLYQKGLKFHGNHSLNQPGAMVPPSYSTISGNHFENEDSSITSRSHFIYPFGRDHDITIAANTFKGCPDHAIKFRGEAGVLERKVQLSVTGNTAEDCASLVEVGADGGVTHESVTIVGNSTKNCTQLAKIIAMRGGLVESNTYILDGDNTRASCVGILVSSGGVGKAAAIGGMISDLTIRGNIIRNEAQFIGELTGTGLPSAGDTVTVGATTYTWVSGAAASATEVQIGTTINQSLVRLADTIRGVPSSNVYAGVVQNAAIDRPEDVQVAASNDTVQLLRINGFATYALSVTGTALTVSKAVTSYLDRLATGIRVEQAAGPVDLINNRIGHACSPIELTNNIRPRVIDNRIIGSVNPSGTTPWWLNAIGNRESEYRGNRCESTAATQNTAGRRFDINDAFPLIGINPGVESYSATKLKDDLHGLGGIVTAGDGKAWNLMFFGYGAFAGTLGYVQARWLQWLDGDTVTLNDGAGHSAVFTFKRTSPNTALGEFNTKATLITSVNASTIAPYITAADYDALSYGYIKFQCVAAGTAGNSATCTVVSKAKTCGVMLTPTFRGGHATAERTFVFTPVASKHRPLMPAPANVAAQSLTGLACLVAEATSDAVEGVGYLIRHSAAGGTEKISFSVAEG